MYSGGKSVESNSWSSVVAMSGMLEEIGKELYVVWWCGVVGARVAAFVWRWVAGVL